MKVDKGLLSEFVKITNDDKKYDKPINIHGTIVNKNNVNYVKMDGSEILTPFRSTIDVKNNDRVIITISNRKAVVTGNLTDPSASGDRVSETEDKIDEFDHIFAGNITADNIQAGSITTEKLHAGAVTAEKIQAGTITAGSGIISDGAIGNAQISNLDAAKINAGTIDTSKVTVSGKNSNLTIRGNRLQVFEGIGSKQFERVSLGDVNNDGTVYGLRVRGKDGVTILYDENGIYEEGITDGSISNDKIRDDANIDGGKLNIGSVIRKINEDGSETINGIKVSVDGKQLDVEMSRINTVQNEHKKSIDTNTSNITSNANAIKLKVDNQKYNEDMTNMKSSLDKHTSEIAVMKDGISLSATKTEVKNQIKTSEDNTKKYVNDSIATYDSSINVKFDGIDLKVGEVVTELGTTKEKLSQVDIKADGISTKVTGLDTKYTELKQTVDGIDITGMVTFDDLSTEGKTTIHGGNIETDTLTATGEIGFADGARITPYPSHVPEKYGLSISAPGVKIGAGSWGITHTGDATFDGELDVMPDQFTNNGIAGYASGFKVAASGSASVGKSIYANSFLPRYRAMTMLSRNSVEPDIESLNAVKIGDSYKIQVLDVMPLNRSIDENPYLKTDEEFGIGLDLESVIATLLSTVKKQSEEINNLKAEVFKNETN